MGEFYTVEFSTNSFVFFFQVTWLAFLCKTRKNRVLQWCIARILARWWLYGAPAFGKGWKMELLKAIFWQRHLRHLYGRVLPFRIERYFSKLVSLAIFNKLDRQFFFLWMGLINIFLEDHKINLIFGFHML